ncbi:MAG: hypothetical protein ACSHWZ_06155 [Sulfitobacter sp.]
MSAPDTNIDRQTRNHKTPLLGIGLAMAFGVLMVVLLGFYVFGHGGEGTADAVTNTDQASEPAAVQTAPAQAAEE